MTFLTITNVCEDVGQVDLGDFEGDDVWGVLHSLNPALYAGITDSMVVDVSEEDLGCDYCIADREDLETFLHGYRFETYLRENGRVQHFATEDEAVEAARAYWDHLSAYERKSYQSWPGAVFMVTDGDGMVLFDMLDDEPPMTEDTKTCRITSHGNALSVSITELARHIGVDKGDLVEVTLRRVDQ